MTLYDIRTKLSRKLFFKEILNLNKIPCFFSGNRHPGIINNLKNIKNDNKRNNSVENTWYNVSQFSSLRIQELSPPSFFINAIRKKLTPNDFRTYLLIAARLPSIKTISGCVGSRESALSRARPTAIPRLHRAATATRARRSPRNDVSRALRSYAHTCPHATAPAHALGQHCVPVGHRTRGACAALRRAHWCRSRARLGQ